MRKRIALLCILAAQLSVMAFTAFMAVTALMVFTGCAILSPVSRETALSRPLSPSRPIVLAKTVCLQDGIRKETGLPLRDIAEGLGTQLGLLAFPAGENRESPPYRLTLKLHLYRSLKGGYTGTEAVCIATLTPPSPSNAEKGIPWTAQATARGRDSQYPPGTAHLYRLVRESLEGLAALRSAAGEGTP